MMHALKEREAELQKLRKEIAKLQRDIHLMESSRDEPLLDELYLNRETIEQLQIQCDSLKQALQREKK